jgi:uncharacterized membrane protein
LFHPIYYNQPPQSNPPESVPARIAAGAQILIWYENLRQPSPAEAAVSTLLKFAKYGALGLLVEVVFTGALSAASGDATLRGQTFLWMFPVWGLGGLLVGRVYDWADDPVFLPAFRAVLCVGVVYLVELLAGTLLRIALGSVPWDYGDAAFTFGHGACDLRYAPLWLCLIALFPRVRRAVG